MQDSGKYLIHADIRASGVVERSDVVGAIFGQTEGLLGDELDLRDLQESSKIGRIDVQIQSEAGRSFGSVTIASGLDRAETAVLAAALETIDRIGPCRAEFEVTELEDARAAQRREIVDRATGLLAEFEQTTLSSRELVEEVRQNARVEDITEFEGLPAGPRVAESDAIVVVEGRADVLTLLKYGIKNAIAVEGTNVPEAVAALTTDRTVTAFLDGDRGGDLILEELTQVGDVDYVAFAPTGRSVEDLSRSEALSALRQKVPYAHVAKEQSPRDAIAGAGSEERVDADGGTTVASDSTGQPVSREETDDRGVGPPETAPPNRSTRTQTDSTTTDTRDGADPEVTSKDTRGESDSAARPAESDHDGDSPDPQGEPHERASDAESDGQETETLAGHVLAVQEGETVGSRLLDAEFGVLCETETAGVFEAIETAETVPHTVVLDGELSQRVLDVAAQRGVTQIVARSDGEFVKRPTSVRIRSLAEF